MKTSGYLNLMSLIPMAITMIIGADPTSLMVSAGIMAACNFTAIALALTERDSAEGTTSTEPKKRKFYNCTISWRGIDVKEVKR